MARSWKSKMGCYEIPCVLTGGAAKAERRLRGNTYQHPYDRTVGTWKTGNENNAAARRGGRQTITILYKNFFWKEICQGLFYPEQTILSRTCA